MQAYDLVMLVLVIGAIAFGFWKGLAWQIASLGSLVVSYFVALNCREPVAKAISAEPPWNMFLAMFMLFVGSWIAVWLGFSLVKNAIEQMKLKDFDRQAGALLGAVKGGLLCILVTFFAVTLLGESQRAAICQSHSGRYISLALNHADAVMPKELHAHLDPYLNKLEKELAPAGVASPEDDLDRLGREIDDLLEDRQLLAPPQFDSEAARRPDDGDIFNPKRAARALFDAADDTFQSTR
jgi:membrane protein required for colicin V production